MAVQVRVAWGDGWPSDSLEGNREIRMSYGRGVVVSSGCL